MSTKGKIVMLVVEDESTQREALVEEFSREGFTLIEAKNGMDGFKMALENRPDMILLDIMMPKMDGLAMLQKLRAKNPWGKKVPVIVLTNLNSGEESVPQTIAECEPAYYLTKSDETLSDLLEKVREVLANPS